MSKDLESTEKEDKEVNVEVQGGSSNAVYGLGLIGAWVYFIGRADTTEERIKGFFKGLAWPAILIYKLFKFLETE